MQRRAPMQEVPPEQQLLSQQLQEGEAERQELGPCQHRHNHVQICHATGKAQ